MVSSEKFYLGGNCKDLAQSFRSMYSTSHECQAPKSPLYTRDELFTPRWVHAIEQSFNCFDIFHLHVYKYVLFSEDPKHHQIL